MAFLNYVFFLTDVVFFNTEPYNWIVILNTEQMFKLLFPREMMEIKAIIYLENWRWGYISFSSQNTHLKTKVSVNYLIFGSTNLISNVSK